MPALIFLAMLVSPGAGAQESTLCPDLYRLKAVVRTCAFNAAFVKAAEACNAAIDRESTLQSTRLAAALAINNNGAASAQSADLKTQSGNLADSSAALRQLRAEAVSADAQLKAYLANFLRPGGISPELAARLHAPFLGWLESIPCYRSNKDNLTKHIGIMQGKIAKLDQTLGTIGGLADQTDSARQRIGADSATALRNAANVHAAGEGATGARAPASGSSITGVKEDTAKRAKTNP